MAAPVAIAVALSASVLGVAAAIVAGMFFFFVTYVGLEKASELSYRRRIAGTPCPACGAVFGQLRIGHRSDDEVLARWRDDFRDGVEVLCRGCGASFSNWRGEEDIFASAFAEERRLRQRARPVLDEWLRMLDEGRFEEALSKGPVHRSDGFGPGAPWSAAKLEEAVGHPLNFERGQITGSGALRLPAPVRYDPDTKTIFFAFAVAAGRWEEVGIGGEDDDLRVVEYFLVPDVDEERAIEAGRVSEVSALGALSESDSSDER